MSRGIDFAGNNTESKDKIRISITSSSMDKINPRYGRIIDVQWMNTFRLTFGTDSGDPGPDTITPFEKRYTLDTPRANAHGITPYAKRYITSIVIANTGDTTPNEEHPVLHDSTLVSTPVESSVYVSSLPDQIAAEPPSSGNNGDQTMRRESDRTDLILDKLNKLMHAIQQPPAYGQGVSQ